MKALILDALSGGRVAKIIFEKDKIDTINPIIDEFQEEFEVSVLGSMGKKVLSTYFEREKEQDVIDRLKRLNVEVDVGVMDGNGNTKYNRGKTE